MRIHLIPAFLDNYIFLIEDGKAAAVIDPGEAAPVVTFLKNHALQLEDILLTHHHHDHIGGAEALRARTNARIHGYAGDAKRLPRLDKDLIGGEATKIFGMPVEVWHVPGHTRGHIAHHMPEMGAIFCGDTLFSAGCGRLFEGTPAEMMASLARLTDAPEETKLYCGHEYTETNLCFALSILPEDAALRQRMTEVLDLRAKGRPTVPTTVAEEKASNLFLRTHEAELKAALNLARDASDLDCFTELRARRNGW